MGQRVAMDLTIGEAIHNENSNFLFFKSEISYEQRIQEAMRLDNVPAGSYQLRVWHPRQPIGEPAVQQTLQVPATGEVAATVRMSGLQP